MKKILSSLTALSAALFIAFTFSACNPGDTLGEGDGDTGTHDCDFTVLQSEVKADCLNGGYKIYGCSHDGCDKVNKVDVNPLGHIFSAYEPDNNGTCIEDGTQTAKCENCEETQTITLPDSKNKNNHNYEWTVIEQTCSTGTKHGVCQWCNDDTETAWIISDVFCDNKLTETKQPTCTLDGYNKYECTKCGNVTVQTLEASGHSPAANGNCTICGEAVGVCNKKINVEFKNSPEADFGTVYFELVVINPEYKQKDNGTWLMKYDLYAVQTYTVDGQTYINRTKITLDRPEELGSGFKVKLLKLNDNTEVTFSGVVDYFVSPEDRFGDVHLNGQAGLNGGTENYAFFGMGGDFQY